MPSYLIAIKRNVAVWFAEKGFPEDEIPYFLHDIVSLIEEHHSDSVDMINRGLEQLGWGIGILDQDTYEKILLLYREFQMLSETGHRNHKPFSRVPSGRPDYKFGRYAEFNMAVVHTIFSVRKGGV